MTNDLISREALKEFVNSSIEQATKVGILADADYLWELLNYAIDNAPTVEYTFEEAFQKTVCEQRLYCPERPQDEWSLVERKKNIDLVCPRCGYHRCNLAYGFSIKEVREQIKEDKSNDYLLPDFCERCGTKLGFE